MTRFFSVLAATIFLVSATVEIASFAIDHKSWFQENIKVVMEYFGPGPRSEEQMQPAQQVCEAACPTFQTANERRCEDIDPSHAFYLGYEMAKAVTALTLGKNYVQDQALRWGFLTRPEGPYRDRD